MAVRMIVIVIAAAAALSLVTAQVCRVCDCSSQGAILCHCRDRKQDLDLSKEFMRERLHVTSQRLSVRGCGSVRLRARMALNVTSVQLLDLEELHVDERALASADSVEVRRVALLTLGTDALLDCRVTSLLVADSRVRSVARNALVAVGGLRRLELRHVTVEDVESGGLSFKVDADGGVLVVQDSHVGHVGDHAVGVRVANVTVRNCSFGTVEDEGMDLRASSHLRLSGNAFGNLSTSRSLYVDGDDDVRVTGNSFSLFQDHLLQQTFTQFGGNQFLFPIHSLSHGTLTTMGRNLYNNSFQCNCSKEFGEKLAPLIDGGYADLLNNTFCIVQKCPGSVSHYRLLQQLQRTSTTCPLEKWCSSRSSIPTAPGVTHLVCTAIVFMLRHVPGFH